MIIYQNENMGKSYDFRSNTRSNYSIMPHIHDYSEILYTKTGGMTMYINGQKHYVPKGHAAIIFPNQIHEYTKETPHHVWFCVFSNDFLPSFFQLYSDKIPKEPVIDISSKSQLMAALESAKHDDIIGLTGLLNLLFSELMHQTDLIVNSQTDTVLYKEALNYISNHFRSDFALSDMAKALGYHEKYLSSALHNLTNMNFRMFLGLYRINYAKKLLVNIGQSNINIAEIALDCGFHSINTFNRVFKQLTGMTPTEYKNSKAGSRNYSGNLLNHK